MTSQTGLKSWNIEDLESINEITKFGDKKILNPLYRLTDPRKGIACRFYLQKQSVDITTLSQHKDSEPVYTLWRQEYL